MCREGAVPLPVIAGGEKGMRAYRRADVTLFAGQSASRDRSGTSPRSPRGSPVAGNDSGRPGRCYPPVSLPSPVLETALRGLVRCVMQ